MPTPKIMSAAVVDKFRESLVIRELTMPTLGGSEGNHPGRGRSNRSMTFSIALRLGRSTGELCSRSGCKSPKRYSTIHINKDE